jgi:hypothetical protein
MNEFRLLSISFTRKPFSVRVFQAFFGVNIPVASDIWVLLNEIPQNAIEKQHLLLLEQLAEARPNVF